MGRDRGKAVCVTSPGANGETLPRAVWTCILVTDRAMRGTTVLGGSKRERNWLDGGNHSAWSHRKRGCRKWGNNCPARVPGKADGIAISITIEGSDATADATGIESFSVVVKPDVYVLGAS